MQIKNQKFLSQLLEVCLKNEWNSVVRPEVHKICFPDYSFLTDSAEITEWLKDKDHSNFMNDGEFQCLMPFCHFTDQSKIYFALGYLIKIVRILGREIPDLSVDFGCYHFLYFLRESSFKNLESLYNKNQKELIYAVLELISLSGVKEFDDAS